MAFSISLTHSASVDAPSGPPHTFSAVPFGTAATDRVIIAVFGTRSTPSITTVTIGGVSTTVDVTTDATGAQTVIARAAVPTGTTGNIVVGSSSVLSRLMLAVYRVVGGTPVLIDSEVTDADPSSMALTVPSGGFAISGSTVYSGSATVCTWTNATEDVALVADGIIHMSAASRTTTTTSIGTDWSNRSDVAKTAGVVYSEPVSATLTTTTGTAVAAGGTGGITSVVPRRWASPSLVDTNTLGTGVHTVFLHDRGGLNRIGQITDNILIRWERQRDDISSATIIVSPEGAMRCRDVLRTMAVGRHEIVIYRNKVRVWEGPITRITWKASSIEVTAHDICHYLTRTIMHSGYDNRYSSTGSKVGPVTERMRTILVNELQRKEALTPPYGILPYLDVRTNEDTANTARLSLPFQRTVWEEMDEMAAKSGLDYVAVGRRLTISDVHDVIGRLPMLSDKDFHSELIVTAYGMELCTYSAVTDGEGRWGAVGTNSDPYYGEVELLHTMYGEGLDAEDPDNPTQAELEALATELTSQAQRNLAGRYPVPTIVRIPDGTGIQPTAPVTIEQLVPGVRVPLRATLLSLTLEQEQKLDRVVVEQTAGGETVSVTLSPAPGSTPWDDSTDATGEEE